jgi:hypothetical protein
MPETHAHVLKTLAQAQAFVHAFAHALKQVYTHGHMLKISLPAPADADAPQGLGAAATAPGAAAAGAAAAGQQQQQQVLEVFIARRLDATCRGRFHVSSVCMTTKSTPDKLCQPVEKLLPTCKLEIQTRTRMCTISTCTHTYACTCRVAHTHTPSSARIFVGTPTCVAATERRNATPRHHSKCRAWNESLSGCFCVVRLCVCKLHGSFREIFGLFTLHVRKRIGQQASTTALTSVGLAKHTYTHTSAYVPYIHS